MIFIFSPFCEKYFENQNSLSVTNFLVFWGKKIRQKRIISIKKGQKHRHNCLQYEMVLKNFH
jgi:hypothetical protein